MYENQLYDAVLAGAELTTKQLEEFGISKRELDEFVQQGILERVKSGFYQVSVDGLSAYGKSLIEKKEYEKVRLCFEKCWNLDPTNLDMCEQLIYEYFVARNYQRMLELLTTLINSKNQYYRQDGNFYLYLFSMIMDLPASYKSQLENFTFEDIKVLSTDTRYQNIEIQNKTRMMAFQDSFVLAHNILFSEGQDLTQIQNKLTLRLLNAVCDTEIESENTILRMVQEKKWDEVFTYLVQKQNRHELKFVEDLLLRLVTQYLEMKHSGNIPKRKNREVFSAIEAIYADQYDIALQLEEQWCKHFPDGPDLLIYILKDICEFIGERKSSATELLANFSVVIYYLKQNQIDLAFEKLKHYMYSIGRQDLVFLVVDLIQISLLENDMKFSRPLQTFLAFNCPEFSIEFSSYIQQFYMALSKNEFKIAKIYLEIIDHGSQIEEKSTPILDLYQILNLAETIYNKENIPSKKFSTETAGKQYIK